MSLPRERIPASKRRLEEFTISELSAVDKPAQQGAKMLLMKHADADTGVPFDKAVDPPNRKRKALDKFELSEVSWVDKPASEHARMTLIKRDGKIVHDEATNTIIEGRTVPLTSAELDHMETLEGDSRRAFLLGNHDTRNSLMESAQTEEEETHETENDMPTFKTFEDAAAHYKASGMSNTLAMKTARSAHPDLVEKGRFVTEADAVAKSEHGQVQKAAAAGADRRNRLDGEMKALMADDPTMTRTKALRHLKDTKPLLFAGEDEK